MLGAHGITRELAVVLERNFRIESLNFLNSRLQNPSHTAPTHHRRASVAGTTLFNVENNIQETGFDYLPRIARSNIVAINNTSTMPTIAPAQPTIAVVCRNRPGGFGFGVNEGASTSQAVTNDEYEYTNFRHLHTSESSESSDDDLGEDTNVPNELNEGGVHGVHDSGEESDNDDDFGLKSLFIEQIEADTNVPNELNDGFGIDEHTTSQTVDNVNEDGVRDSGEESNNDDDFGLKSLFTEPFEARIAMANTPMDKNESNKSTTSVESGTSQANESVEEAETGRIGRIGILNNYNPFDRKKCSLPFTLSGRPRAISVDSVAQAAQTNDIPAGVKVSSALPTVRPDRPNIRRRLSTYMAVPTLDTILEDGFGSGMEELFRKF